MMTVSSRLSCLYSLQSREVYSKLWNNTVIKSESLSNFGSNNKAARLYINSEVGPKVH